MGDEALLWKHLINVDCCVYLHCFNIIEKLQKLYGRTSLLPPLPPSQALKTLTFAMKFFLWDHLYVDNMFLKFQVRNMYLEKDIWTLKSTSMCFWKGEFYYWQLWHPLKDWIVLFFQWFFLKFLEFLLIIWTPNFKFQKINQKKGMWEKLTLSPKNIHQKIVKLSISMTHVGRFWNRFWCKSCDFQICTKCC